MKIIKGVIGTMVIALICFALGFHLAYSYEQQYFQSLLDETTKAAQQSRDAYTTRSIELDTALRQIAIYRQIAEKDDEIIKLKNQIVETQNTTIVACKAVVALYRLGAELNKLPPIPVGPPQDPIL